MVRKTGHMKTSGNTHLQNEEESLRSFLNGDSETVGSLTPTREMEALEKWLTTTGIEEEGDNAAWLKVPNSKGLQSSEQPGFEDNFSDFVSAPPAPIQSNNNEINISRHEIEETTGHIMGLGRHGIRDDDDDDDDTGRYDFSHVLAGLDDARSKIAGIEDEHERRKAAAKVALSLAYGFGNPDYDFDD